MSNIYIQEPPSHGKVLLETTAGDIDIELWSREAPKACRNFIQLCMEGYYDGTIFHRLVKQFIVQGGDPTGTGQGGKSIWGKPFKDEFHSRLRFVRRGLVAMANAGKDDNGSQFFFTLGPTQELQNKHTLFGKVTGNTIYNMLKLEEGETGQDEKPLYPHKILSTKILLNPFDDIVPRESIKKSSSSDKRKEKKESGTKNYKLLSFGEEAEEEEEEVAVINKKYSGKSKSSHDLTNDPKLSSQLAVEPPSRKKDSKKRKHSSDDEEDDDSDDDSDDDDGTTTSRNLLAKDEPAKDARLLSVQEKLKSKAKTSSAVPVDMSKMSKLSGAISDDDDESYYLGKDEELANKKKLEDLKKEYKELRGSMKKADKEKITAATGAQGTKVNEAASMGDNNNDLIEEFLQRQKQYKEKTASSKVKGAEREAATMALLAKFSKKLETAKEKPKAEVNSTKIDAKHVNSTVVDDIDEDPEDDTWLTKSLHYDEGEDPTLAKEAHVRSDENIHDPKNPLVQRRRQDAKRIAKATHHKRDLI